MNSEHALSHATHLSDDSLDTLLIGEGASSELDHLATCELCSARLETFRSSLSAFNQASAAWSEARSNSINRELNPRRSVFAVLPAWAIAAAFFFAAALSFIVTHRGLTSHEVVPANFAQTTGVEGTDRQQEIATDNAMLHAIDTALSQPVRSPVEAYDIEKTSSTSPRRNALREVRD